MTNFKSSNEKTKQAFEMIEQGVKDVYSSDSFKQYLSCLSKFHNYSLNNTLLILAQKPNASLVAGYRSWQINFNRHVDKGEKGLMILAPVTYKEDRLMNKVDENGNVELDESGSPIQEQRQVNITRFKTTTVFDISQTSGEPIPSLIHNLTGSSHESRAIIQSVQSICTIPIEFKIEMEDLNLMTGAKGYYSPSKDKIVINKDLEDLQIAKTLIHEYAHSHADKIKIVLSKKENNMELLLADNGVGIEKEDLKHIFERLYKCDKGRSEKGSGLGLSIVHQLVEKMGGSITVESLPGKGTEFMLLFPLES